MLLRNHWHVAAGAVEVGPAPLARTILGESADLYRTGEGARRATA